jgi:hypothetical protein
MSSECTLYLNIEPTEVAEVARINPWNAGYRGEAGKIGLQPGVVD